MAVTIAASPSNFLGPPAAEVPTGYGSRRITFTSIAGDSSYPTGGYTLDPFLFNLNIVDLVITAPTELPAANTYFIWNQTTRKLQAFTKAGAEVANTTNLTAVIAPIIVAGN